MSLTVLWEHIFIVLCSVAMAVAMGIPLGIWCYLCPRAKKAIMWIVDVLQTIPALALLGIIMVIFGAGKQTVIIGVGLYSLLPIVNNTCLGLEQVDSGVKEAALGMGMGRTYRLFNVELPLALPTMFTGIRIAAVNSVGSAVFAAFVGGGGLGTLINNAIRVRNMGLLLQGTVTLMIIATVLDLGMSALERRLAIKNGANGSKQISEHERTVLE